MVKITDKSKNQTYYFPKHLSSNHIDHILEIRSLITKNVKCVNFTDNEGLRDYYTFNYAGEFKDLEDGEYAYSIDEDKAFGILILGDYYLGPSTKDLSIYDDTLYTKSKIDIQTIEDDEKILYYE